jgi:hypothetical protein
LVFVNDDTIEQLIEADAPPAAETPARSKGKGRGKQ